MGNDTNSLWADPLFTNLEAGDYSLRPGSPALDLGINQIILGNFVITLQSRKYVGHNSPLHLKI